MHHESTNYVSRKICFPKLVENTFPSQALEFVRNFFLFSVPITTHYRNSWSGLISKLILEAKKQPAKVEKKKKLLYKKGAEMPIREIASIYIPSTFAVQVCDWK